MDFIDPVEDANTETSRNVAADEVFISVEDTSDTQNTSAVEETVSSATQRSILKFFSAASVIFSR